MKLKEKAFSRKSNGSQAFCLAETLVGMGMVGVVFTALYSGMTAGFFTLQSAREEVRATQIMQDKLEMVRLYSWDKITQPGFIPASSTISFTPITLASLLGGSSTGATYQCSLSISNAPLTESYSTNMRLVTVKLAWQTGNVPRQRSMTTLVTKNGLQNYIN